MAEPTTTSDPALGAVYTVAAPMAFVNTRHGRVLQLHVGDLIPEDVDREHLAQLLTAGVLKPGAGTTAPPTDTSIALSTASRYRPIFTAWLEGLIDLPESLVLRYNLLATAQAKVSALGPGLSPDAVKHHWVNGTLDALDAKTSTAPDFKALHASHTAAQRHRDEHAALMSLLNGISTDIAMVLNTRPSPVLTEYVWPKMTALRTELAGVSAALNGVHTAEQALRGSDEQRAAWVKLPALNVRYARLRGAAMAAGADALSTTANDVDVLHVNIPSTPPTDMG